MRLHPWGPQDGVCLHACSLRAGLEGSSPARVLSSGPDGFQGSQGAAHWSLAPETGPVSEPPLSPPCGWQLRALLLLGSRVKGCSWTAGWQDSIEKCHPHPHPQHSQLITTAGGRACGIGKAFLLIPSLSTQLLMEKTAFHGSLAATHSLGRPHRAVKAQRLGFPRPLPPRAGPGRHFLSHESACEASSEPGPPARIVLRGELGSAPSLSGLAASVLPLLHPQSSSDLQSSTGSRLPPRWGRKEPLS